MSISTIYKVEKQLPLGQEKYFLKTSYKSRSPNNYLNGTKNEGVRKTKHIFSISDLYWKGCHASEWNQADLPHLIPHSPLNH